MNFDLNNGLFFASLVGVISLLYFQHRTIQKNTLHPPISASISKELYSCSHDQYEENTTSSSYTYEPSCSINSKEHLSAIKRTQSQYCKKKIAELACRSVDASDGIGDLYPSNLPNLCLSARTLNPKIEGQYLGNTRNRSNSY